MEQQQAKQPAQAQRKALIALAVASAIAVSKATDQRDAADATFKETAINAGKTLRRPGAALGADNALHDTHKFYLDEFAKRLMVERGEKKASGYTRRVKSDFSTILGAMQIHSARVTYTNAQGKKVTEHVQVQAWLEKAGHVSNVVKAARLVKTSAGFISKRGKKGGEVSAIKGATLAGILSKLDGRLSLKTLEQTSKWLTQQGRMLIAVDNRRMYDATMDGFLSNVKRICAETPAAVARMTSRQAGKLAQSAVEQPQVRAEPMAKQQARNVIRQQHGDKVNQRKAA